MSLLRISLGKAFGAILLVGISVCASGGVIDTVAGTGLPDNNGDAGRATQVNVGAPFGVEIGPKGIAVGPAGHVYVVDTENQAIRKIDSGSGLISTVAGVGPGQRGPAGGPATEAQLDRPHGICVGTDGTLYLGDTLNHRVRRVRP